MNPNPHQNWDPNSPQGRDYSPAQAQQRAAFAARAAAQQAYVPAQFEGQANPEAQRRFMTKVFGWMTLGLGLTATASVLSFTTGLIETIILSGLYWPVMLAPLAFVFGMSFMINRMSSGMAMAAFLSYALVNGVSFAVIFLAYTSTSIASTFLITTMTFGFMFVLGWTTKRDLTSMGSLLMMALFGLFAAMIVNMFFASGMMSLIISVVGVLIFVGLTAWDAQKLKQMSIYGFANQDVEDKGAIMGALTLYLDFINIFLFLLRLMGGSRD